MLASGKGQVYEASTLAPEWPADLAAATSSLPDSSLRSTTIAVSLPSSEGSACIVPNAIGECQVAWRSLRLGDQIQPFHRYAYCVSDVYLLDRFLELSGLSDIDGDSVKLLLRCLKLLRLCDYSTEDICAILAHASAYFEDAWRLCGDQMDNSEIGNVLVTLLFIAHCYVQDETCPLHIWHQHLFKKYCVLKTLNAAVVRLMQIRSFVLRLPSEDLYGRVSRLRAVMHAGMSMNSSNQASVANNESEAANSGSRHDVDVAVGLRGGGPTTRFSPSV